MCRSVFSYTESIVRPNELHRNFHQSSHTQSRFHIVREYEESSASRNDTTMQSHTDATASNRQFRNTSMKKGTREIVGSKSMRFLQEAVRLIRISQIGRSTN